MNATGQQNKRNTGQRRTPTPQRRSTQEVPTLGGLCKKMLVASQAGRTVSDKQQEEKQTKPEDKEK